MSATPETSDSEGEQTVSLLDGINSPADLKTLSAEQLKELAEEIRAKILAIASVNGGHLAPHLGVVELSIALHYVYETENDALIWDVGHQCYPHKILTGRRDQMETIRQKDGLSGYPKRGESPYDCFGVGHSSTSISAALGMAVARDRMGERKNVVAIIGDGAITAGMAWEAMSHAGHLGTDMLVILNDNEMSISKNVGAVSSYFNRLITHRLYNRAKQDVGSIMSSVLGAQLTKAAQRIEHSVKGMITEATVFEQLGWRYVGPVDGHDLDTLIECMKNLKELKGPIFFHVVTRKGKGYSYAEEDPTTYHGVKAFDIATGKFAGGGSTGTPVPTFTDAFAEALIEEAKKDPRIVGITAAMGTGTGLSAFEKQFPERAFDVGICEQHAVTFAAGLAAQGMRPVAAIYSTFLQRGFDQYVHDVCLQNLPVVFAIDRAGCVGEDSPTQQGAFDLSFLRIIPNIKIGAPRDALDLKLMFHECLKEDGPTALRYARSKAPAIGPEENRKVLSGEVLRPGADATLLGIGPILANCLLAAESLAKEGLDVGVVDARWIKPLDEALLDSLTDAPVITVEENTVEGGFGSMVLEYYERQGRPNGVRVHMLGFPDEFITHMSREEQLAAINLDIDSICDTVRQAVKKPATNTLKSVG